MRAHLSDASLFVDTMPEFENEQQAIAWMIARLEDEGEDCIDNERFAFEDDAEAMSRYAEQQAAGCCGSFDQRIMVSGRPATFGCNFGH